MTLPRTCLCALMLLAALTGAACSYTDKPVPCPVCYEDEWSREPFPGEAKQHIKALTPEDIKANGGKVPMVRQPLGATAE